MNDCRFLISSGPRFQTQCTRKCKDNRIPYCLEHLKSQKIKNKLLSMGYSDKLIEEVKNKIYFDNKMFKAAIDDYSNVVKCDEKKPLKIEDDDDDDFQEFDLEGYPKHKKQKSAKINKNNNAINVILTSMIKESLDLDKDDKISDLVDELSKDIEDNLNYEELPAWIRLSVELFSRRI